MKDNYEMLFIDDAEAICEEDYGFVLPESAVLNACKSAGIKIMIANGRKFVSRKQFNELMPVYFEKNRDKYSFRRKNISLGTSRFYIIQRALYEFIEALFTRYPDSLRYFTTLANTRLSPNYKAMTLYEASEYVTGVRLRERMRKERGTKLGSRFVSEGQMSDDDYNVSETEPRVPILAEYSQKPNNLQPLSIEGPIQLDPNALVPKRSVEVLESNITNLRSKLEETTAQLAESRRQANETSGGRVRTESRQTWIQGEDGPVLIQDAETPETPIVEDSDQA